MAMDRSHDSRSAADASARPDEIDPWSEFLSESSEELQQLQSTRATTADDPSAPAPERTSGVSIVSLPATAETSAFADELPHTVVSATPSPEAERSSIPAVSPDPLPLSEPESAASQASAAEPERAPAQPRDGAPPFTRRMTLGRSYELPVPVVAASPPMAMAPQEIVSTSAEVVPASLIAQTVSAEERPLVLPEPSVTPPASIWKTPPTLTADEAVPHDVTAPEAVSVRPKEPQRPPVRQSADSLRLSEVLARQTPVHWAEAIATVEALCAALDAGTPEKVLVPDLADILITSSGDVRVRPGASGEPDVAALGRTLQSLLATTTNTPLPLRLFVTSAISSDRYASVALFAEALSDYALSGRTQLIQALHKRAIARSPSLPAVPLREQPVVPVPGPRTQHRGRMKTWTIAAAVGIVAGALAAAWLWGALLSSEGARTPVKTVGVKEPSTAKRTEDWTPGPILVDGGRSSAAAARSHAAAPAARSQTAPRVENRPTPGPSDAAPPPAPPPIPSTPVVSSDPRPAPVTIPPPPEPVSPGPAAPTPSKAAVVVDSRIYSDADLDVEAPVLLSPMLFLPAPASPKDPTVTRTLEVVIDARGSVQNAKLLESASKSLSDFHVPQQAKLLKFRPATKDGHPVMYRHRMRLTSAPY